MRILKKLVLAIVFAIIMLIVFTNITVSGYGEKGKLNIKNTEATWKYGWHDMTANGDGWGPYYDGVKTYFWKGEMDKKQYYGFDLLTLRSYSNVYCAQKYNVIACPVLWTQIDWRVDIVRI